MYVSFVLFKNLLGSVVSNGGGDYLEVKEKYVNGGGKFCLIKEDLVVYFVSGCKFKVDWRLD